MSDDGSTDALPSAREASDAGARASADEERALDVLLEHLKRARGFDFTGYKRASLTRRIRKRMQSVGVADYVAYLDRLEVEPGEFVELFNTILINVTHFFRDADTWELLARDVVPGIVERADPAEPIRLWSAGCATGQEAYTLAMLFAEALPETYAERVKVYATDVDDDALAYARHASYSAREVESLSPERLERFFELAEGRFCVRKELRRTVIFGRNDLIQDAPISRIDVLACRNALMYFDSGTQGRVLSRFHFALAESGVLVLGRAETMLTRTNLFTPLDLKRRVFAKVPRLVGRLGALPTRAGAVPRVEATPEALEAHDAAFNVAPVAQIVVDRAGRLTMANDRARGIFHLIRSDIGRPLQDLEISYRPTELRGPIMQAMRDRQPVVVRDVRWRGTGDEPRWFEVQVSPLLAGPGDPVGASVSFTDVTAFRLTQERLEASAQELESAYEELQSTNEELETTNEELHSTVEELETTNEELQSTNEELETMNEELQSTNEELHATNDELRRTGEEMNAMNAFQEGIFSSLRWGIVVLDGELNVLKWNQRAEGLWGLRTDEVEGEPFLALDSGMPVKELAEPVRRCLAGHPMEEELVIGATNRLGRPIECRFVLLPLRSSRERTVRGVIVLMEEKSAADAVGPDVRAARATGTR